MFFVLTLSLFSFNSCPVEDDPAEMNFLSVFVDQKSAPEIFLRSNRFSELDQGGTLEKSDDFVGYVRLLLVDCFPEWSLWSRHRGFRYM